MILTENVAQMSHGALTWRGCATIWAADVVAQPGVSGANGA